MNAIIGATMLLKLIGGFFVCLWAADFVTGLAHWLEDTYCLENYPLIGSFICEPNIEHHIDPQLMVREGTFFSRNLLQWGLCGGTYVLLWLLGLGGVFTFTILLFASFGNEIHRWNHMSKTSGFVTFMKDSGLIQVQKQHSLHHKQPHNQYYCVMTSLLNAILERVNFWRKLEWVVEVITGIAPKRENRRDSKPLKKKSKIRAKEVSIASAKKHSVANAECDGNSEIQNKPNAESSGKSAAKQSSNKRSQLPVVVSLHPTAADGLTASKSGCGNCVSCVLSR